MTCEKYYFAVVLAVLGCVECHTSCFAQVARYQPRTSTVSPYLNLGRFNGGGLPNYFALVRPQIQQRQINVQSQALARRQATEITRLQNEVQQELVPAGMTGNGSWFMTQGTQSSYLRTGRFYPDPLIRGRGR